MRCRALISRSQSRFSNKRALSACAHGLASLFCQSLSHRHTATDSTYTHSLDSVQCDGRCWCPLDHNCAATARWQHGGRIFVFFDPPPPLVRARQQIAANDSRFASQMFRCGCVSLPACTKSHAGIRFGSISRFRKNCVQAF